MASPSGGASLLYAEGYHAHNVHFILTSAMMGGDGETAMKAAEELADMVSERTSARFPGRSRSRHRPTMSTRIHKPEEAEAAFRAALERSPNNGWVAAGLLRAAEMRGDAHAAAEARKLMQKNRFGTSAPELSQL